MASSTPSAPPALLLARNRKKRRAGSKEFKILPLDNTTTLRKDILMLPKRLKAQWKDVAKQIDEFSFAQKEKAAMQAMDDMMIQLESDYQAAKKMRGKTGRLCKKESSEEAAKIRASIQAAHESVALAKKSAILSMKQAVNNASTEIETKTQTEYATAKSSADAYYKKIQASEADKAAKVKTGIVDAEKKLEEKKSKCIEQYEKALTDATAKLVAAQKEASEEYDAGQGKWSSCYRCSQGHDNQDGERRQGEGCCRNCRCSDQRVCHQEQHGKRVRNCTGGCIG